ncbi:MAG TPA: (2Fe-2S)-binding protein [Acidimicrobiia bacterium]|nr:(2Fe-2S)-binding protein [Acidimicrobiia bacterium]
MSTETAGTTDRHDVSVTVNGRVETLSVESRRTLAEVLREDLGLTGTHLGCEHGVCGACTVALDGEPVRSCLVLAVAAAGGAVETVESLAGSDGGLHPIQQAMWESHSFQCAFCAPGFLMTVRCLLESNPAPTRDEIREELSGNLCRCTGYQSIVAGVEAAIALLSRRTPAEGSTDA